MVGGGFLQAVLFSSALASKSLEKLRSLSANSLAGSIARDVSVNTDVLEQREFTDGS